MIRLVRSAVAIIIVVLPLVVGSCTDSGVSELGRPPRPPQKVTVQIVKKGAEVSWSLVPSATHYTVFWGTASKDYRTMADCQSRRLLITGLQPGKMYALAVSSWSHTGESDFSREEVFVYDTGRGRPAAYLAKASQLMREGCFPEAHAYITAAIRLDPRLADAYRLRAALNEQLNEPELARQDYAKAEKLFSGNRISLRRSTN
jgi:hypothetical protein